MALISISDDVRFSVKNPWDDDSDDVSCDGGELLAAAEEGRGANVVMSILEKNSGLIQTTNPVGNTVLHIAVRDGDFDTVCKLIAFLEERQVEDLEAVLVHVNVDGDSPFDIALKNGHREVVDRLKTAERKAVIIRDENGPIFTLSELLEPNWYGEIPEDQKFQPQSLKADVEMRAIDEDLMTRDVPVYWHELYRAINQGNEDSIITWLMKNGKQLLWHKNYYRMGETLLHRAATATGVGSLRKFVEFMISNGMTDAALVGDVNGNTPLHWVVQNKELSRARCLIKAVPKTAYQLNQNGVSPLYVAVKEGRNELLDYVMRHCRRSVVAPEVLRHPRHATLAHLAIKNRSFDTLKILMEHIPELVKVMDQKGWRPLSYAANKGYLEEVELFLTKFPETADKRDKDGSFPIHKAVGGGHVSIIKAFYEYCPHTLHHIDRKGRSVLHIAASYERADILTYLTKELQMDDSFSSLKDHLGKTFKDYA